MISPRCCFWINAQAFCNNLGRAYPEDVIVWPDLRFSDILKYVSRGLCAAKAINQKMRRLW